MADYPMRINKYLAHRGFSTRKDADALIEKGLVLVNGRRAVLGQKVEETDTVEVKAKERRYRYFAFNKPRGVITHSPQFGEKDVVRASGLRGVFPVGRLDKASHGLIILTDDARITDKLLNPDYEHEKEYKVTATSSLPTNVRPRLERGVNIEGYQTRPAKVRIEDDKTFYITLTEGKKHQVRRMCAAVGVTVADLERVRVGNVRINGLKPGEYRQIEGKELEQFRNSLGKPRI